MLRQGTVKPSDMARVRLAIAVDVDQPDVGAAAGGGGSTTGPRFRVQQRAVPMLLQDSPATLDGIVLAMVRRIIHQLDFQSGGVREPHQPVQELGSSTRVLRAVVQVDHQLAGGGMPRFVRLPPLFQTVHNEVTGLVRCPDEDTQQARGHVHDPVRYQFLLGLGVVIQGAGSLGRAALPVPGEVPHIHFGLGVHGNPHDIGGVVRRLILLTDILENRISFGNFFQGLGFLCFFRRYPIRFKIAPIV